MISNIIVGILVVGTLLIMIGFIISNIINKLSVSEDEEYESNLYNEESKTSQQNGHCLTGTSKELKMTKYEVLYGVTIEHFPNEKENVQEKLKLVRKQIGEFVKQNKPYSYETQCELHELNQAQSWCKKILEDIET